MEGEETHLKQNTPSSPECEAESQKSVTYNNMGSDFGQKSEDIVEDNVPKQVLPFCFVKILPTYPDAHSIHTIQEAVRLFEQNDQVLFQISENIREKVFDRERLLSRLRDLKNYYLYRHKQSTAWKMDILSHLHMALDNFSLANKPHKGRAIKSSTTEEELDNKKLNFRMLHGSRNLAEEKQLLRDMNMCQKTNDASSSPLSELMEKIQRKYSFSNYHCKQNNCDKLLKEMKHFEVTGKNSAHLKESIRKQVKIMTDELMEIWKKKRELETKIKRVEKGIESINEEIWSFQKHLKDKNYRKDASLFILQESKIDECWVLKYCNLEYQSIHFHTAYLEKSSSQKRELGRDSSFIGKKKGGSMGCQRTERWNSTKIN
ncbi:hypothetical protein SESBI_34212 [Sesbania bispinosa]|nr:hypothetical protein SESBI_34212 [Sesbania bispinosa]